MKTIFALHGFLGRPSDWNFLKEDFEVIAVDYFQIRELQPHQDLKAWGASFNQWVNQNFPGVERNLVGYSLGGRLALQAISEGPGLWNRGIFISTNPGCLTESERKERLVRDRSWAQEFLQTPWEILLKKWNEQPVFAHSKREPDRHEKDFDRQVLSDALLQWSVGQQRNFLEPALSTGQLPSPPTGHLNDRFTGPSNLASTTWIAGELDAKFKSILKQVEKMEWCEEAIVVEKASHRVHFDQPQEVRKILRRFK